MPEQGIEVGVISYNKSTLDSWLDVVVNLGRSVCRSHLSSEDSTSNTKNYYDAYQLFGWFVKQSWRPSLIPILSFIIGNKSLSLDIDALSAGALVTGHRSLLSPGVYQRLSREFIWRNFLPIVHPEGNILVLKTVKGALVVIKQRTFTDFRAANTPALSDAIVQEDPVFAEKTHISMSMLFKVSLRLHSFNSFILKAYVQQLESSRVKLTQLEQELRRARHQEIELREKSNDSHRTYSDDPRTRPSKFPKFSIGGVQMYIHIRPRPYKGSRRDLIERVGKASDTFNRHTFIGLGPSKRRIMNVYWSCVVATITKLVVSFPRYSCRE
ncbi:hypothetical protein Syun_006739 [Stephania yunnanensis]|uniref:Uncharacterized protein n=1 Tax=Stephania yunnanensis TaxID=152371 RepID=A0AAP0KYL7_9MAGN